MNIRKILVVQEIKHNIKNCLFDAKSLKEDSGRDASIDRSELNKEWASLYNEIHSAQINVDLPKDIHYLSGQRAINVIKSLTNDLKHSSLMNIKKVSA